MGTAHIQVSENLLHKLESDFSDQITIINYTDFGDGSFSVSVSSDALPEGYNGVQEIYVVDGTLKFRRETDT
jgi:hypothetical protein